VDVLDELISVKLEYDQYSIFAIELTELLRMSKNNKYTSDTDIVSLDVDATQITYIII
jgi:hypothetical protein